ncbi:MAG: hypothetical protein ACP5VP_06455 [Candidatus Limnocylindrales bacterium]
MAALVLLLFSGLLFAIHVPNGMFLHASVSLAPVTYWLAMEGIVAVAGWIAARRRSWDAGRLARLLAVSALALVIAGSALAAASVRAGWESTLAEREQLTTAIDRLAAPGDRLMSIDSATFEYLTGHGGIVIPNDPLPVIEQAARAYGVRWLILERNGAVPALAPLLSGAAPPDWLGPPAFVLSGASPAEAVIYPVCFDQALPGCTSGGAALRGAP